MYSSGGNPGIGIPTVHILVTIAQFQTTIRNILMKLWHYRVQQEKSHALLGLYGITKLSYSGRGLQTSSNVSLVLCVAEIPVAGQKGKRKESFIRPLKETGE